MDRRLIAPIVFLFVPLTLASQIDLGFFGSVDSLLSFSRFEKDFYPAYLQANSYVSALTLNGRVALSIDQFNLGAEGVLALSDGVNSLKVQRLFGQYDTELGAFKIGKDLLAQGTSVFLPVWQLWYAFDPTRQQLVMQGNNEGVFYITQASWTYQDDLQTGTLGLYCGDPGFDPFVLPQWYALSWFESVFLPSLTVQSQVGVTYDGVRKLYGGVGCEWLPTDFLTFSLSGSTILSDFQFWDFTGATGVLLSFLDSRLNSGLEFLYWDTRPSLNILLSFSPPAQWSDFLASNSFWANLNVDCIDASMFLSSAWQYQANANLKLAVMYEQRFGDNGSRWGALPQKSTVKFQTHLSF